MTLCLADETMCMRGHPESLSVNLRDHRTPFCLNRSLTKAAWDQCFSNLNSLQIYLNAPSDSLGLGPVFWQAPRGCHYCWSMTTTLWVPRMQARCLWNSSPDTFTVFLFPKDPPKPAQACPPLPAPLQSLITLYPPFDSYTGSLSRPQHYKRELGGWLIGNINSSLLSYALFYESLTDLEAVRERF